LDTILAKRVLPKIAASCQDNQDKLEKLRDHLDRNIQEALAIEVAFRNRPIYPDSILYSDRRRIMANPPIPICRVGGTAGG
jgi:hypothetical protein